MLSSNTLHYNYLALAKTRRENLQRPPRTAYKMHYRHCAPGRA